MNEDFVRYLQTIGMAPPLVDRVKLFFTWCSTLTPTKIREVFVSDFIDPDGTRLYGAIWFFTETHVFETGVFTEEESFDCVPLRKRVARWDVSLRDYDLRLATERSRMALNLDFGWPGIAGTMQATRENCDHLTRVLHEWVLPNMRE